MDKNINFDYSYTSDSNHLFLKKLLKLGFNKSPKDIEHPGKRFCSFIEFKNPIGVNAYLEFINVKKGGNEIKYPGFSFSYKNDLDSCFKKLSKKSKIQPCFSHKNYYWRENSIDRLPGWNFVTFEKLGFKTIYPWFTEYEPPHIKRKRFDNHSNMARTLIGFDLTLNSRGLNFFQEVMKVKIKDKIELSDGTIWNIKQGRLNKLSSINLRASSLNFFRSLDIIQEEKRVRIINPSGTQFWNISIHEN